MDLYSLIERNESCLSQVLRKPKEFLIALLQKFVELLTKSSSGVSFVLFLRGVYFGICVLYCHFRFPLSCYFSQNLSDQAFVSFLFCFCFFYYEQYYDTYNIA